MQAKSDNDTFGFHRQFLRAQSVFDKIGHDSVAFKKFITEITLSQFEKGEVLYRAGEESNMVYLVRDGEVQLSQKKPEGQERITAIHGRGSMFSEVSFLNGEAHGTTARVVLDSSIYCIPGKSLLKLMEAEPSVGPAIARLVSYRLHRARHKDYEHEYPARVHTLFYPENPHRSSQLAGLLAAALVPENPGPVLLLSMSQASLFKEDIFPALGDILNNWPQVRLGEILARARHSQDGFDILVGTEIHDPDFNVEEVARIIPALLGRLKKYYATILVDAGRHVENPALARILSQSDRVVLIRDPYHADRDDLRWKEVTAFCTEHVDDFFQRVVTVCDEGGGRVGGDTEDTWAGVNPLSALYRNHFRLRSLQDNIEEVRRERIFNAGLNRLARNLSETSRGIVLGGGGARACAHIGVLDVLDASGIDFDVVAGTSMGAVIGAGFAAGYDANQLSTMVSEIIPDSDAILDKGWPIVAFFRGRKLNQALYKAFGDMRFSDLEIPFYCNGTDLDSATSLVFEKGYLATALRASVSLPGVYPPFKMGQYRVVDGGVINNMPGDILRDRGYNRIIGVNVSPLQDPRAAETRVKDREGGIIARVKDYFSLPPILKIINRAIAIQGNELLKFRMDDFDFVFHPDVNDWDVFDFRSREAITDAGRRAAEEHLSEIKASLYRHSM